MPLVAIENYLVRHARLDPVDQKLPAPKPELKLTIVIPSLAEQAILPRVLDSLLLGSRRLREAEVIVLLNNTLDSPGEILENNRLTLHDLKNRPAGELRILAVDHSQAPRWLPPDQAGVGWARRLGMDLALQRLNQAGAAERSAIACLDADAVVGPGYIDRMLEVFDAPHAPLGGLCHYAHPQPQDLRLKSAMVAYELWLRYHELGMALAESFFAFPVIGSCMAASAEGYALADGMPLRKAAEDFHFLRKLAKVSGFRPLARIPAEVYPEARVSQRVPFGTGRAMQTCLEDGLDRYRHVEPPETYFDLQKFFRAAAERPDLPVLRSACSTVLLEFLETEKAWVILEKFQRNYPQTTTFRLAIQHWFDSLRIVRFGHFYAQRQGEVGIYSALTQLLTGLGQGARLQSLPSLDTLDSDSVDHELWLQTLRNYSKDGEKRQ